MKTKYITSIGIILVIIIALCGFYYFYVFRNQKASKLVGSTFVYDYYVTLPQNGTYENIVKIHVTSVKNNNVMFNYSILSVNGTIKKPYVNQSFTPVFNPSDNLTYFKEGSFGMPLFINSSVKNETGITYIEFQGNESIVIKYSVLKSSNINVNLTLIPYYYTYNLGASNWKLVYNRSYGYLVYARGSFIGADYISFEYKLVNASV